MIKVGNFIFLSSILLIFSLQLASANTPPDLSYGTDLDLDARIFYVEKDWTLLSEILGANQTDSRDYRAILLGGYYHLLPNLRAGLFYQRQYGVRHDEDWFKDPVNGWQWVNPNGRGEDLVLFDISPKFALKFLPGKNWTFEFKTRFENNFFDQDQTLRIRPNLSYFWIRDGKPLLSFFLQEEQAFPLNYGVNPVNERWTYLGALYHFDPALEFGGFVAEKWQAWTSTPQFIAQTGQTYQVSANTTEIGFLFIYKFENTEK